MDLGSRYALICTNRVAKWQSVAYKESGAPQSWALKVDGICDVIYIQNIHGVSVAPTKGKHVKFPLYT